MTNPINRELPDEATSKISNVLPLIGFIYFKPVFKNVIWGGSRIARFKGMRPNGNAVGESWEISHVEGDCSVVASGLQEGQRIDELIATFGERLLGRSVMKRFGSRFPLLIKLIDATDDLSLQVHPNDELARERHGSWGKTEMWYAIEADDKASLYSGFEPETLSDKTRESIISGEALQSSVTNILRRYEVKPGDVFFLPAGRVHAIGKGCFMAEIQQTSNITYRISDYDRTDKDGNKRELHVEEAREAINIDANLPDNRLSGYERRTNSPTLLARCPYFTTNLLNLEGPWEREAQNLDSFIIYMCLSGKVRMTGDGIGFYLQQGQTVLVPAEVPQVMFEPESEATLLEVYWEDTANEYLQNG